ncbi:hypothetical protein ACLB2K_064681 [Fragaria x ananassa]
MEDPQVSTLEPPPVTKTYHRNRNRKRSPAVTHGDSDEFSEDSQPCSKRLRVDQTKEGASDSEVMQVKMGEVESSIQDEPKPDGEVTKRDEQIKAHLQSLVSTTTPMSCSNDRVCQFCASGELLYAATPTYCSNCGCRIKERGNYYSTPTVHGEKYCFCSRCYNNTRSGDILLGDHVKVPKASLEKKKNDEEIEEPWVRCGRCEGWQHQICALYNDKFDSEEYACFKCVLREMELGEHKLKNVGFCAKDLPTTMLSDHIEKRLIRRLEQERKERMSNEKGNESSEVVGVEVKYFTPAEGRTATGEALRTFVYHEVLIGYLEFCKKQGFVTAYIWACPPAKEEDYILYCHPPMQKTPLPIKLRKWYQSMIKKASNEGIVVGTTNLYDRMFAYAATKQYCLGKTGLVVIAKTCTFAKNAIAFVVVRPYTHMTVDMEQHVLSRVTVMQDYKLPDTKDGEIILNNGLFEERTSFLNFCVKNHYQFDTLRQAKYSLLMILHHLSDLTALTSAENNETCSSSSHKNADQSLVCEINEDKGSSPMVGHVTRISRRTKLTEGLGAELMKELLQVLKHAALCFPTKNRPCSYPNRNCLTIKKLFVHVKKCSVRASGGCQPCNKAWVGLIFHSRICTESNCVVPRCMDQRNYRDQRGKTRDGTKTVKANTKVSSCSSQTSLPTEA